MTHASQIPVISHLSPSSRAAPSCSGKHPGPPFQAMEQALPVLQTLKQYYSRAVNYHTYRFANSSTRHNKAVLTYIFRMVMKVKSQVKAHLLDPSDSNSIISFLTTFKLAYETDCIRDVAVMRVLSFSVKYVLSMMLNSYMSASTQIAVVFKSVNTVKPMTQKKPLCSYYKVVNYLLQKFKSDQSIAKMDSTFLHYTQPHDMTLV